MACVLYKGSLPPLQEAEKAAKQAKPQEPERSYQSQEAAASLSGQGGVASSEVGSYGGLPPPQGDPENVETRLPPPQGEPDMGMGHMESLNQYPPAQSDPSVGEATPPMVMSNEQFESPVVSDGVTATDPGLAHVLPVEAAPPPSNNLLPSAPPPSALQPSAPPSSTLQQASPPYNQMAGVGVALGVGVAPLTLPPAQMTPPAMQVSE